MHQDVSFLLLSGGVGSRSGHNEPKQFRKILKIEMIGYALRVANAHPRVAEIVANAPEGYEERTKVICERYAPDKPVRILPCGATRQESVAILCAAAISDIVILHEAARPMIDAGMIDELLMSDAAHAGMFSAIPFSMCEIDEETGFVVRNVPRSAVYNIQLPQKFDRAVLDAAHKAAAERGAEFTEDTVLVSEMTGQKVRAIAGHARNIKVTTPEDFGIVANFMGEQE